MNNKRATRPEAVAGLFYPEDPSILAKAVDGYLANPDIATFPTAQAAIAPHAGFVYSGPIAGNLYSAIAKRLSTVDKVMIIGPSHRVAFQGIALSGYSQFGSPLGPVPIHKPTYAQLKDLPQVSVREDAHAQEHGLEVHLPFLARVMNKPFSIIPVVVGQATPQEVAEVIAAARQNDAFVLISSDLSHFHDYDTAKACDQTTTQAILDYRFKAISPTDACGAKAIQGFLYETRNAPLNVEVLDLRNSGDTAGGKDRVVGYGAYVFY